MQNDNDHPTLYFDLTIGLRIDLAAYKLNTCTKSSREEPTYKKVHEIVLI